MLHNRYILGVSKAIRENGRVGIGRDRKAGTEDLLLTVAS